MNTTCVLENKSSTRISELRDLLGHDVLLLPCEGKKPDGKWKHLTIEAMNDPRYLQALATGNVGVALGARSGGLCVVDFDADGEDGKFLALNPEIADTLRTHGNRGSSFWLRIVGEYPASKKLKAGGRDLGEWRANGNQSIIAGLHPTTGQPYQFLNEAQPVEIPFGRIVWPDGVPHFANAASQNSTTKTTSISQRLNYSITQSLCKQSNLSENDIVKQCLATDVHTSNPKLFALARGVLTLERQRGEQLSDADLKRIFGKWHCVSLPHLRPDQTREKYFAEFLEACDCAERPLDENVLALAWEQVKIAPLPESAAQFKSSAGKTLVSLCWQLQLLAGDREFFLSCYSAAPLLKMSVAHAAGLMRKMVRKKILRIVEHWRKGRATRYRFISKKKSKPIIL